MSLREVFLTGASGTIGSALAPRLLAMGDTRLTLLLRARDDAALDERLSGLLIGWGLPLDDPRRGRVSALRGDIAQPGLGLSSTTTDTLAARTTHVIHCAASVKLNMTMDEARATTVEPTRALLDFGRRAARVGSLRKMEFVSTVGVWGRTPGQMPERRLPEVRKFHNTYEAAKSEAERIIWSEGDGLPLTVHRPSMVVGETGTGHIIHFQVFYHLCEFLAGMRTFGVMPRLGGMRLDTVPVDWVANAIAWSSATQTTSGRILHLCSGPGLATPLTGLQACVRQHWVAHGLRVPTLRTIDQRWLERLIPLIGALVGPRRRRALRALGPAMEYLAEEQGFDNRESRRLLADAGLPLPAPDSYLDAVLEYYLVRRRA